MTLSNSQFQIFFNKNPVLDQDKASSLLSAVKQPSRPSELTTKFNLSFGGVYQSTSFNNNIASSEIQNNIKNPFSNDFLQSTASTHTEQPPVSTYNQQFSPSHVAANLYAEESFDYEDLKSSTPCYAEDADDKLAMGLDDNSKKIRKEKHGMQFKPTGNKKNIQESLKIKTKRNPWQLEEDEQVLELVARYGQSWALIASLMKERSGKQIRDRYLNKLKPDINKGEWAQSEDDLLMSLCRQIGHKWSRIATYLPGRTEGQVKNRFYSHIKKRMGKWTGSAGEGMDAESGSHSEHDEGDNETGLTTNVKEENLSFGSDEASRLNKNSLKSIDTFNCAGNYSNLSQLRQREGKLQNLGFSSLSIKVNNSSSQIGFTPKVEQSPAPQSSKSVTYNFTTKTLAKPLDPTDVISYSLIGSTEDCSTAEEIKSPFSGVSSAAALTATRISSINQPKDFEEVFDKMTNLYTNNTQPVNSATSNKSGTISFSISNGSILPNKNIVARKVAGFQEPASPLNRVVKLGTPSMGMTLKNISQMDFSGSQGKFDVRTY